MQEVPIFVISLESRSDRRSYLEQNFRNLNTPFSFVNAIHPLHLPPNMQNSAIAIWSSHVKALGCFLASNANFALILEDDVDLSNKLAHKLLDSRSVLPEIMTKTFGIMQLGEVDFSNERPSRRILSRLYFVIFNRFRYQNSDKKQMVREVGKHHFKLLSTEFRRIFKARGTPLFGWVLGSQAYLVNRESAAWIISNFHSRTDWDLQSRFSLDTYLDAVSRGKDSAVDIKAFRFSRQVLPQRRTQSDNSFYPKN